MPEDMKASDKELSLFAEMSKRLAESFAPQKCEAPAIRASVLEAYAKRMINVGYEMTEPFLQILCQYLKGYNIWICGNVGIGKTFFFDCISKVRCSRGMGPISKLSMIETQGWTMEDAAEWARDNIDNDVLIDDVGAEPLLNHYGEKIEVFPYLLEKRMRITRRRTHLTSNLGPIDILKRYDRRVADRFAQMFKMCEVKTKKSRRRLMPWKQAEGGVEIL